MKYRKMLLLFLQEVDREIPKYRDRPPESPPHKE